jgi:FkbM family methyltransferase
MNTKKKIYSYIKQNNFLSMAYSFLMKRREKYKRMVDLRSKYKSVIRGGEILLYVDNFKSEYFIDPRSDLALRVISTGGYEEDMVSLIQKFWQGGSIVNVGANIGFWAIALPKILDNVDKVIAIEPNPSAFNLLKKNIAHNQLDDTVSAVQVFISSDKKNVVLETVPGMSEYSSMNSIVHPAVAHLQKEKITVESTPLDEVPQVAMNKRNFNLLFVDVEGAEFLVFQGSQKFIMDNRPVVIFECSDRMLASFDTSVAQIVDFWHKAKYVLINISTMKKVKNERFSYDEEVLAIPEEFYNSLMSNIK